ncbi:MAG: FtsX-like permease family protein, partial [Bacilli bacterium]|nr:FtsX-like permease family protein [Bacilli bacterium]
QPASSPIGFVEINNEDPTKYGYKVIGSLPDGSKNEIAITDLTYAYIKEYGYHESKSSPEIKINSYENLINRTLTLDNEVYKITGIVDTGLDFKRYAKLDEDDEALNAKDLIAQLALQLEYENITQYSYSNALFVGEGAIQNMANKVFSPYYQAVHTAELTFPITSSDNYTNYNLINTASLEMIKDDDIIWNDGHDHSLANNEIILGATTLRNIANRYKFNVSNEVLYSFDETVSVNGSNVSLIDYIIDTFMYIGFDKTTSEIIASNNFLVPFAAGKYYATHTHEFVGDLDENIFNIYSEQQYNEFICRFINEFCYQIVKDNNLIPSEINYKETYDSEVRTFKVVGIELSRYDFVKDIIITNKEVFNSLKKSTDPSEIYSYAIGLMPKNKAEVKRIVKYAKEDSSKDIAYKLENAVIYEIDMIDEILVILRVAFVIIGIILVIFAALLFSTFIASSVTYKKREIGILRAIGSRTGDVYKIFFSESFIIAMINFAGSITLTGVAAILANNAIKRSTGIMITLLNFGFRQIGILLLVAVGIAALATLLPVIKFAKKKPIEAINNK